MKTLGIYFFLSIDNRHGIHGNLRRISFADSIKRYPEPPNETILFVTDEEIGQLLGGN
jgi:hypothetical protein